MRLYTALFVALLASACETVPPEPPKPASVPIALQGQHIKSRGEVQSLHSPYAVMVRKFDRGDRNLRDLAEHGLPLMIVFVNLSNQPVDFGPGNIQISGVGPRGPLALLSENDIEKIKQAERSDNNSSSFFDVLFAIAGTAQAGQLMQSGALSQSQATAVAQGITTFAISDMADNNAQNDKSQQDEATLIDHYQSVVLPEDSVGPRQQLGGMVFVRNASPDAPFVLTVTTGDYTHRFAFVRPDQVPQLQASSGPAPGPATSDASAPVARTK